MVQSKYDLNGFKLNNFGSIVITDVGNIFYICPEVAEFKSFLQKYFDIKHNLTLDYLGLDVERSNDSFTVSLAQYLDTISITLLNSILTYIKHGSRSPLTRGSTLLQHPT